MFLNVYTNTIYFNSEVENDHVRAIFYFSYQVLPDEEDHFKSKKYDGVFHCRLCRLGIWEDIYVDDRLPVGSDGFICGSSSTIENEMWIPLLEKAYAK